MAHELNMPEPQKVLTRLDEGMGIISKIMGTIQTTADISKMNLAIGGLDATFNSLASMNEPLTTAKGVFSTTKDNVATHVAEFARKNSDITY